jgi:hypothetical protein
MRWLSDHLGNERLLRAQVLLPTEQFFPDPYQATQGDVQGLVHRLGAYMGVETTRIRVEVLPDVELPEATGRYVQEGDQTVIQIAESQLANLVSVIATLTHELAHEILSGRRLLTVAGRDHEWVTDLVLVYLGVGIPAANTSIFEDYAEFGWGHRWTVRKQGYLPPQVFGYAFALFAFMRGEHDPHWAQQLRLDVRSAVQKGLCFLRHTNDSFFHPDTIRDKRLPLSPGELAARLRSRNPSIRLITLMEMSEQDVTDPVIVAPLVECLSGREPYTVASAADALAALGPAAAPAIPQLTEALVHPRAIVRAAAAHALGALRQAPDLVIPQLCTLLNDDDHNVVAEAAHALCQFREAAEPFAVHLVVALTRALVHARDRLLIELLTAVISVVTTTPERCIRQYVQDYDLRQDALAALKEHRARARDLFQTLAPVRSGNGENPDGSTNSH